MGVRRVITQCVISGGACGSSVMGVRRVITQCVINGGACEGVWMGVRRVYLFTICEYFL